MYAPTGVDVTDAGAVFVTYGTTVAVVDDGEAAAETLEADAGYTAVAEYGEYDVYAPDAVDGHAFAVDRVTVVAGRDREEIRAVVGAQSTADRQYAATDDDWRSLTDMTPSGGVVTVSESTAGGPDAVVGTAASYLPSGSNEPEPAEYTVQFDTEAAATEAAAMRALRARGLSVDVERADVRLDGRFAVVAAPFDAAVFLDAGL